MLFLSTRDRLTHRAVAVGVSIPILYYGVQVLALPYADRYSVVRQVASELGMAGVSSRPAVFNVGKILGSIPIAVAACGFLLALQRLGARRVASWLTFVGLMAIALNEIQAGIFPLPDARHEGIFLLGYPLWSFSFLAAAARLPASRVFRIYLAGNIALALLMLVARIAFGALFEPIGGLFQRLFGLVTVVPIGVAAWFLAARFEQAAGERPVAARP